MGKPWRAIVLVALILAGCGQHVARTAPPARVLFVPPDASHESQLILSGLRDQLAVWKMKPVECKPAATQDVALRSSLDGAPGYVVAPCYSREAAFNVAEESYKNDSDTVLIGWEAATSHRLAIVRPSAAETARLVAPLCAKRSAGGGTVLLYSDAEPPSDPSLLEVELIRALAGLGRFDVIGASASSAPPAADLVIALGPIAMEKALVKFGTAKVIAAQCGDAGEKALRNGRITVLVEPNWYFAGQQAAQIVHQTMGGSPPPGIRLSVPQEVVTRKDLPGFLERESRRQEP